LLSKQVEEESAVGPQRRKGQISKSAKRKEAKGPSRQQQQLVEGAEPEKEAEISEFF
jgi:hypothetical protein